MCAHSHTYNHARLPALGRRRTSSSRTGSGACCAVLSCFVFPALYQATRSRRALTNTNTFTQECVGKRQGPHHQPAAGCLVRVCPYLPTCAESISPYHPRYPRWTQRSASHSHRCDCARRVACIALGLNPYSKSSNTNHLRAPLLLRCYIRLRGWHRAGCDLCGERRTRSVRDDARPSKYMHTID